MFKHRSTEKIILGCVFVSLLVLLVIAIRNDMITDAEYRARAVETLKERVITISPRAGVECYILTGASSVNPRSMSCVSITRD